MEGDEHPESGAKREALEETGLEVKPTHLLGIYMDHYGAGGEATLNLAYVAEIVGGEPTAGDDVAELEWVPVGDLPIPMAFRHQEQVLKDLKNWSARNPL